MFSNEQYVQYILLKALQTSSASWVSALTISLADSSELGGLISESENIAIMSQTTVNRSAVASLVHGYNDSLTAWKNGNDGIWSFEALTNFRVDLLNFFYEAKLVNFKKNSAYFDLEKDFI